MNWAVFLTKIVRYGIPLMKALYDIYSDRKERQSMDRLEFLEMLHADKQAADERRRQQLLKDQEGDDGNA